MQKNAQPQLQIRKNNNMGGKALGILVVLMGFGVETMRVRLQILRRHAV